jgi:hypothetical protein
MPFKIDIHNDTNSNIQFTVALPIYNSKKIAWLALESLIRQENVNFDWELIVFEEIHSESVCPQLLDEYKTKLINNNCKRIVYITQNEKPSLLEKWIEIGKNVSETSIAYMLQAADCYSPKNRLRSSYDAIVDGDYDWYDQTKGYFYSFVSNRVILYNYDGMTNLNMCLKTKYIKTLPFSEIKRGIDGYIYRHLKKSNGDQIKHYKDENLYLDSIDTHGLNNISVDRESFFVTKPNIFTITNLMLENLGIDQKIIEKIKSIPNDNFVNDTILNKPNETVIPIPKVSKPKQKNNNTQATVNIKTNSKQLLSKNKNFSSNGGSLFTSAVGKINK